MRPLIPDVVCEAWPKMGSSLDPLIIEVTVTNVIDDDRKERIRAQGVAALEIDLSMTGGRVTRSELHRLVVHEVSVKRWLNYPDLEAVRAGLQEQMQAEQRDLRIEAARIAEERRRRIQEAPIADIAGRYLQAVERMLIEQARFRQEETGTLTSSRPRQRWRSASTRWRSEGTRRPATKTCLGTTASSRDCCRSNATGALGYGFNTAAEVLNAIQQSQPDNRNDWTLYLSCGQGLPAQPLERRAGVEVVRGLA
jgi:hypothetical protein